MQRSFGPLRVLTGTLAAAVLWAAASAPVPATAAPSLAQVGSKVEALGHSDRTADVDANQPVNVQLALKLRDPSGAADLVRRVSTPGSAEYGQYLTPQQFAARFGPTQQQVEAAASYLRSNGLTVTGSATGSILVNAIGTAAHVAQATHTSLGRYRDRSNGRDFYANDAAPTLPSGVASLVQAIHGLDNHAVRHHSAMPNACCAGAPYSPSQVRSGYDFTAAPISGLTGSGQTMGLMELNTFSQTNLTTFDTAYGLTPPPPQVQAVPPGGVDSTNSGELEVELDIEVMQGIAPAAGIMVFEAPNSTTGVNNAYACMGNPNALGAFGCPNYASGITAPANSTSWGLCENDQGLGETQTLDSIFQQAAATGHSFYAASGDTGTSDGCSVTPAVDSPASDPFVTGTGGTKLFLNQTSNSWNNETAWPAEPRSDLGSGGGLSSVFTRPGWQAGPGVINGFSNGNRQVPDVALNSDPLTGFSVYSCSNTGSGSCSPGFLGVGGTSAAAPGWAAFTAIYNQYAASLAKPNLGFANPAMYASSSCAQGGFHDITQGSNPNNSPFSVTPGWDYLTGLGSFDAAALVANLSPPAITADPSLPTTRKACSTTQYTLKNSNGVSWQELDASLRLSSSPTQNQATLLSANSDLWTENAGFNQDLGIFVSDNGGSDQLLGWKESGGRAGTFSPNAAYLQTLFNMSSGHSYIFKLKWKTNNSGGTIHAGAGPAAPFSQTSLVSETFPSGAAPNFVASTTQYTLIGSDGLTWTPVDDANLATTLSPNSNATALLGGNADLWTQNAGYNQDLGIFVSDNNGPYQLVAWKESGGNAGTFSPNAAFVKATYPMTGGHTYKYKLQWKTNTNAPGTTIRVGAGPAGPFSPTSLVAQAIPSGANPYASVSTSQYPLSNSDGATWQVADPALNVTVSPSANTNLILGANADMWTENAGYNQDLGIFVADNGGPDQLLAWKESGGFAGTFSPNAAFTQWTYQASAGHSYVFKLKWKTNRNAPGATIHIGAGPSGPFSPTRLTVELTN